MSNNVIITNDIENICRTCLSREDLKPLYEKCFPLTCLTEKLMYCTFVKFTEDDGLPAKICTNCIYEINQAFSFAKRCETIDSILQKCLTIKTELANNSFQRQEVEPIINAAEEIQIEIMPEIISPNIHRTVQTALEDYKYVEEVKQEEVIIEYKCDNVPVDEYKCDDVPAEDDDEENQDETYSKKSDNSGSKRKRKISRDSHPKNVCSVCSKAWSLPCHLKRHMKMHTREKPYTCGVCSKAFTQSNRLKMHMRLHTGEKLFTCEVCSKAFALPSHLKRHMRIHSDEKPYICGVCSKAFIQPMNLKMHMRIHTEEKCYTCEICSKTFILPGYLKHHMKLHSGEKAYNCKVCSKAFTQPNNLKRHMRLHTREQPYNCKVCSQLFTHPTSLKRHMRVHTGEKPYTCGICNKTFSQPSNLKRHMRLHIGENLKSAECAVRFLPSP